MKFFQLVSLLIFTPIIFASDTIKVKEIAADVYVHFGKHELPNNHNHGEIANIGFIIGDKCVTVIDSGANPTQGKALKNTIQTITSKPICYVINTHAHPDHIYGNRAFKDAKVKFVGHHKLSRAILTRSPYYFTKSKEQFGNQLTSADVVLPSIEVKNTLQLDLGNRILELTAHPSAHTDHDLSIYDSKTDTLWLSDLLFREHLPVLDGSINGWISELERLEQNSYTYVIPGHGALVTDWKHSLQPQKKYLLLLRKEIRLLIQQGKFLEDAIKTVAYSEQKRWKLFNEFHKKNISTAFAELEWEE